MDFEWDENKRREIIASRGVDLLYAALLFDNPYLTKRDDRREYGEQRYIALGHVDGEFFSVVYTPLEPDVFRLITAWKAGRNGERRYKARFSR